MEKDDVMCQSTASNSTISSTTTDEILQDGTKVRTLETSAATIRFCFVDDTSTDSDDDVETKIEIESESEKCEVNDNSEGTSTTCDFSSPIISPNSIDNFPIHDLDVDIAADVEEIQVRRQRSIIDEDQIDAVINNTVEKTTVSPTSEYYSEGDSSADTPMDSQSSRKAHTEFATITGAEKVASQNFGGARQKTSSISSLSSQKSADSASSSRPPSSERFNPFNKSMEEDYFTSEAVETKPRPKLTLPSARPHSVSSSSGTSGAPDDLHQSVDDDEFVFAHLGLDEDYFSQPEGHFGLSTSEELEMAIDHCKELIAKTDKESRKEGLVQKLVQLRLKLQDAKETPQEVAADTKLVMGHHFQRQDSRSAKHYCEKCVNVIWGMLQIWYKCRDCGYSCHSKCLMSMTRMCALTKIQESPQYVLSICPERGLASQQYRCSECRAVISFKSGEEPRQCDYNGNYYCSLCHWNDSVIIPARVLHNWDFTPAKVCRASKQYLRLMQTRPTLCIQETNPMLFSFVEELSEIKRLRQEILMMKQYFLSCQNALTSKLLLQLSHRQHFVDGCDMYSLQDLIDLEAEVLVQELCKIHTTFAQHIKTDCERCHAKGHICEICNVHEALFPFDNHVFVCQKCQAVLHKHCFRKKEGQCPRCRRKGTKTKPNV